MAKLTIEQRIVELTKKKERADKIAAVKKQLSDAKKALEALKKK